MNTKKELAVLEDLVKKSESDKVSFISKGWFKPIYWLVTALFSIYLFKGFQSGDVNLAFLFLGAAIVGMSISFVAIQQNGERVWGYIKKHIDLESVKKRINEINT